MDNGNHVGGSGNGGFHSYRRSPQPTPAARSPSPAPDIVVECIGWEQGRFIPNVIFAPHSKISDEGKHIIQVFASEFMSFVTNEAYAHCQREQRNTITIEDVRWVVSKFGLDDYIDEPLTVPLPRYHEDDGGERVSGLIRESLLKRPMVDGDMQGDASSGSTSQCAGDSDDVESPAEEGDE